MLVIKPSYTIVNEPDWDEVIISLEKAIRTCYKSEKKIDAGTADRLIRSIIERGHESTLEHANMTVRFVCDRGVSHEMVRHRLCSFSQESTRYVNYSPEGKNNEGDMQFILPGWIDNKWVGVWTEETITQAFTHPEIGPIPEDFPEAVWLFGCAGAQRHYNQLINLGWKPEQARSVLPNSLKTEIVVTTNMRDWRHIFHLRCDRTAHPQMRELMVPLWCELRRKCPTLFDSVRFSPADEDAPMVVEACSG